MMDVNLCAPACGIQSRRSWRERSSLVIISMVSPHPGTLGLKGSSEVLVVSDVPLSQGDPNSVFQEILKKWFYHCFSTVSFHDWARDLNASLKSDTLSARPHWHARDEPVPWPFLLHFWGKTFWEESCSSRSQCGAAVKSIGLEISDSSSGWTRKVNRMILGQSCCLPSSPCQVVVRLKWGRGEPFELIGGTMRCQRIKQMVDLLDFFLWKGAKSCTWREKTGKHTPLTLFMENPLSA